MSVRLGILDFGEVHPEDVAAQGLNRTLDQAMLADRLGFTRYWLAEHHDRTSSWASPELLVPLLASRTQRIHIGTAGILLRYYSPLKIACDFSLAERLYPGRIDLGLARGLAGENNRGLSQLPLDPDDSLYGNKLAELIGHLTNTLEEGYPASRGLVIPPPSGTLEIWLMGTSQTSAELAAAHGLAFAYSLFLSERANWSDVNRYVESFRPSRFLSCPKYAVAVAGVCAETTERAMDVARSRSNRLIVPTLVGAPHICADYCEGIRVRLKDVEFILLDVCSNVNDRRTSYSLLSEAFGLEAL